MAAFRCRLVLFLFLISGFMANEAAAQTAITWTSDPSPINYGPSVTYSLTGPQPASITSITWTYQNSDQTCPTIPTVFGTGPTVTVGESYIGTFNVWAKIVYGGGSGGAAPPPVTLQTQITIPPPDSLKLNTGNNVLKPIGQYNPTTFLVYSNDQPVSYNGTFVQELITNLFLLQQPQGGQAKLVSVPMNNGWVPASGSSISFSTSGSLVTDKKGWPGTGKEQIIYNLAPAGVTFMKVTQSFRFAKFDACGNLKTWPCSTTFTVSFVSDGQGNYKITHQ
jgi:hypothetical protein